MAPAVPLIAAVAGAAATAAVGAGIVGSLVGAVVTFGIGFAGSALFAPKKPKVPSLGAAVTGREIEVTGGIEPHQAIVGRARVSGAVIFRHARDADGVANKYYTKLLAVAGHPLADIEEIFIDNEPIVAEKFKGLVRWETKFGRTDQTAMALLLEEAPTKWSENHKGRRRALVAVRMAYDQSAYKSSDPTIAVVAAGATEIFDPRSGRQGWSRNPALIVGWFLQQPFGFNVPADRIDQDSLMAAANICDEAVPLAAGGTEPRYTADGAWTLDQDRARILEQLVASMAGQVVQSGGRWYIEAGAWRPPVHTLTETDLRGDVTFTANRARRDLFNGIRATYVRADADYAVTDAPVLDDLAARAQDGGDAIYADQELPFTTSGTMAQRLMAITLKRNRLQRGFVLPCNLGALRVRAGETVTVTLPRYGTGTYTVTGWRMAPDGEGIDLTLEQIAPEIYAWNPATDEQALGDTPGVTGPSGTSALVPVLTLTPPSAPAPTSIAASWSAVSGALDYELSWRGPAGGEFTVTTQAGTSATISTGGRAEMKVRARKATGFGGYDVAAFPPDLTRLVAAGAPGGLAVEWAGAETVQIFTGTTDVFADATLGFTSTVSGGVTISLSAGPYFVWARAIGDGGAVGAELGPIEATADDPATGGGVGSEAGGGGTGETEGPGSGGPSGGSAGAG
jgi:hypothetical protein